MHTKEDTIAVDGIADADSTSELKERWRRTNGAADDSDSDLRDFPMVLRFLGPERMDATIGLIRHADSIGFGMADSGDDMPYDSHRHLAANLYHLDPFDDFRAMPFTEINRRRRSGEPSNPWIPTSRMGAEEDAALYLLDVVMHPEHPDYMRPYRCDLHIDAHQYFFDPEYDCSYDVDRAADHANDAVPMAAAVGAMRGRGFDWMLRMLESFLDHAGDIDLVGIMGKEDFLNMGIPMGKDGWHPLGAFGLVVEDMAEGTDWEALLSGDGTAFGVGLADAWARMCSDTVSPTALASRVPSLSLYRRWRRLVGADRGWEPGSRPDLPEMISRPYMGGWEWMLSDRCIAAGNVHLPNGISANRGVGCLESGSTIRLCDILMSALEADDSEHIERDYGTVREWLGTHAHTVDYTRCYSSGPMDGDDPVLFHSLGHHLGESEGYEIHDSHAFDFDASTFKSSFRECRVRPEVVHAMMADMADTSTGALLAALDVCGLLTAAAGAGAAVKDCLFGGWRWMRFPPAVVMRLATMLDDGYPLDMVSEIACTSAVNAVVKATADGGNVSPEGLPSDSSADHAASA